MLALSITLVNRIRKIVWHLWDIGLDIGAINSPSIELNSISWLPNFPNSYAIHNYHIIIIISTIISYGISTDQQQFSKLYRRFAAPAVMKCIEIVKQVICPKQTLPVSTMRDLDCLFTLLCNAVVERTWTKFPDEFVHSGKWNWAQWIWWELLLHISNYFVKKNKFIETQQRLVVLLRERNLARRIKHVNFTRGVITSTKQKPSDWSRAWMSRLQIVSNHEQNRCTMEQPSWLAKPKVWWITDMVTIWQFTWSIKRSPTHFVT